MSLLAFVLAFVHEHCRSSVIARLDEPSDHTLLSTRMCGIPFAHEVSLNRSSVSRNSLAHQAWVYIITLLGWLSTYLVHAYYNIREWTNAAGDRLLASLSGGLEYRGDGLELRSRALEEQLKRLKQCL